MKNLKVKGILTTLILTGIFLTTYENVDAKVIRNIEINGNKRVSTEHIKLQLMFKEGDDIDDNDANNAISALYNSGLFDDVKMSFSGQKIIIKVNEAPLVNKVFVEGSKKIRAEELGIKLNEPLSLSKIKMVQMELLRSYLLGGMYNTKVNPKIIKLPDNKVNIVFEIDETGKTKISDIVFYGNKKISSFELLRVISSRTKRWYRIINSDSFYSPEKIEADKDAIVRYYKNRGFAQARVESVNAELTPDGHDIIISFRIHEGERFKFGNVTVNSTVKRVNEKILSKKPKCKTGKNFNAVFLSIDTENILRDLNKQGISSVNVEPRLVPDNKNKKIDVFYDIKEGEKRYISKIIINGNERTRDHVILKELLFDEGDIYNKTLMSLSENNLRSCGFFKPDNVRIETIPDPMTPDKCIVIVSVKEQKTGSLSFDGKYLSADGPMVSLAYGERNFLGTGKVFNLSIDSSRESTGPAYALKNGILKKLERKNRFAFFNSITAEYSDPHMFGRDIEGSLSFYKNSSSPIDSFTVKNTGVSAEISYPLATGWTQCWEVSSTRKFIDEVVASASPAIKSQVAIIDKDKFRLDKNLKYFQNNLKHTVRYSTYVFDGLLKGNYSASLSTTFMYNTKNQQLDLKNVLSGIYVRSLGRGLSLKWQTSCGALSALGSKEVHIADGFSNSVYSVRGFSANSIGGWVMKAYGIAKDAEKNEYYSGLGMNAIGTKRFFTSSAELSFPINLLEGIPIRGFLFADCGYYWKPIDPVEKGIFQKTKYSAKDLYNFTDVRKRVAKVNKELAKKIKLSTTIPVPSGVDDEKIVARSGNLREELTKMTCKYEDDFDEFGNGTFIGHKILNEKKLRVSAGFGFSIMMPLGTFTLYWGFPVRKGKFDSKQVFGIGMNMGI